MDFKIGKFFSTAKGNKFPLKVPKLPKKSESITKIEMLKNMILVGMNSQSYKKCDLENYKDVSVGWDEESNSILIRVKF